MLTDIEIAQGTKIKPIVEIAAKAGLGEDDIECYGKYKAKLSGDVYNKRKDNKNGKLIYVTAITPTPAGEGKTCTAVGLTQGLGRIGKNVMLCLREPSLGPTFGVKGGAAGGGYSQVLPMEDINLHFTGDIHAVGAAHNLLAAMVDNHIVKGNALGIDPVKVTWRRVMDISDRQLRSIITGIGGKSNGIPKESGFDITVASEIMAILCLASDMEDLKKRLGDIMVGYTYDKKPVYARDLKAVGAMAVLLKDAIKPNLVQTVEGQPALIHGGPFANIAHGNNSIIATRTALKLADYVVTEGGFAADLGAEKFFDIVTQVTDLKPDVAVVVATVRALKSHGGVTMDKISDENIEALSKGCENLKRHVENISKGFGLPLVVAVNRFPSDTDRELDFLVDYCKKLGARVAISEVVACGGAGGENLAKEVLEAINDTNTFKPIYTLNMCIEEKIQTIAQRIYGARDVVYTKEAKRTIGELKELGYGKLPVCIAKTQMSFSDDPGLKGAPEGWDLNVREIRLSAGAGFIVVITGAMMTMPGLPLHPAAERIDILEDGTIVGLF